MLHSIKGKMRHITSGISFRIIFSTVLMIFVFELIASVIGYLQFTKSMTKEYRESAFRTALTAATLVNGDKIDSYLETGTESYEYRNILESMNTLCQKQNVTLLYVIDVDTSDYNSFRSVFNTVNDNSGYTPWEIGYERETTNDQYRSLYRQIYEEGLQEGVIARTSDLNGREPHVTVMIPINNKNGEVTAIMCVERPMAELTDGRRAYCRHVVLLAVAISILSSFGIAVSMRREFVRPMKSVIEEAARFTSDNTCIENEGLANISKIREIKELGACIEKMEHDTLEYVDNITRMTAEKERIGTELSLANEIQANMLPNIFPPFPERHDMDIYASMTPAKEVGGDFYDFFLIDDNHLGLVIADVSGKGVPAALFMMMSKILISNLGTMNLSPAEVLHRANDAICKNNQSDMFVTAWFGILDLPGGHLVAANAGHEYPVIKRANGRYELFKDPHRLAIGIFPGTEYVEYELELQKGDTLFLYTDGVPEATNSEREMLGTDRMLELLNQHDDADLKALLDAVKAGVGSFVGDAPQFDDLTMMAIRRT